MDVWPHVVHLIDRAFEFSDGKFSKRYVFDSLLANQMQLWVCSGCVLVTRILNYPEKKVFELFLCGGEKLAESFEEFPVLEDFARSEGCASMEIWGRKGWERMLRPLGFDSVLYVTRKDL